MNAAQGTTRGRWLARRLLGACLWALAALAEAQPLDPPRLEVLASYHRGNPWTDELLTRIEAAAERLGVASVDVDYLDARRLLEAQAFELQRLRLRGRRAVDRGDHLLLLDDAALRFYLAHTQALGDPARVVALGVNDPGLQRRALAVGIKLIDTTGVAAESLRFLQAVLGPPLPLLVLGDSTPVGQDLTTAFLRRLTREAPGELAGVLWDWTPDAVEEALSTLPPDTRVYLVEGQTTGEGDLDAERRDWLPRLEARGIRVFCHLPYQVELGCDGGAILDTRRLGTLAVETLYSPAFAPQPDRQTVGAGRRVLNAHWYAAVSPESATSIEWLDVQRAMGDAEQQQQRLLWAGAGLGGLVASGVVALAWSRRRGLRRERRLMVDRVTGLPSRQLLEVDFPPAQPGRDGWLFELASPRLRQVRARFGLPAAQAMLGEQLPQIRERLPRGWRLYADAGLNLLGWIPAGPGVDDDEARFDALLASLDEREPAEPGPTLPWHASLLRLAGHEADLARCCAALDEGLARLERQGWRQPVLRVAPVPREKATRFRRLADELEALIEAPEGQWRLVLQSQWAANGVTLVGAEALLRWRHPRLGEISPGEFLPVVDSLGLSERLDAWVSLTAIDWLGRHQDRLGGLPRLSINVGLTTLDDEGYVARLAGALERWRLPAERLEIEITEHADFGDLKRAEQALARLRRLGVRVALDDFGTGYTAFRLLQRLPFDVVKLDRTLLEAAGQHRRAVEAYVAMVRFCRELGLEVVAEGVETAEEAAWLAGLDVQVFQGFHLGRPMERQVFLERHGVAPTSGAGR
ncbi:EAL domain-containing protein [Halomonas beimenensis]|uniref:Diguanylate cyclase/phosphodiesterase (GGDEF & EAL domains) with PAS/PAC sensor(S) n=1 Tax=Halomonas beimenensis TaxID=475662 RepID=A0A291P773_9GAMM|nr:EAL domain-containing protein [Halomonas beimenensis]ATJ82744.1 diguanylate cyclase/phosphodiesterase (GGDEF & EAL domains) with PAS/PAC sensor(s) [Halomonas beimenensis]